MPKPWYSIKAAATESDVAEVTIHDEISRWYGVSAVSFLAELSAASKSPNIRVSINSYGGHVVEALAMFNGLRAMAKAGKTIEVRVIGIAASAASYLAMAADAGKLKMPRNTAMLLHKPANGFTEGRGTADEHRATADQLDSVESMLLPAYKARFKGTDEELAAIMDSEELLTAERCLELGLCDEVVDEITATASFDVEKLPPEARKVFEAAAIKPAAAPAASAVLAEEVERLAIEAGLKDLAGALAVDPRVTDAETARSVIAEVREISALCRMNGMADQVQAFVSSRKPLADVRTAISAHLAAEADANPIVTAAKSTALQGGASDQFIDTNALWKEIKANRAGSTTK